MRDLEIIKGKIVKIIDSRTIVIDRGWKHGVKESTVFEIYQIGDVLRDPDTGEVLDTLDFIKGKVMASTVYENITRCKTLNKHKVSNTLASFGSAVIASGLLDVAVPIDLDVEPTQITGIESTFDKVVKLGDPVRSVPKLD
jgi:hypothetical protein